jgi:cytochrome c oxidase cbb3-type subunit 3
MSGHTPHKDELSGIDTTGHEWDGIRELDNPLPRWWLWIFYASILFAIGYWVVMPAWPSLTGYTKGVFGQSDRADVGRAMEALNAQRGAGAKVLKTASLQQIEQSPELQAYALAVGQSVFGDNCATCHGAGGAGGKGYPNLRDDIWIWGGALEDIHTTLQFGIRSEHPDTRLSQMPAFGRDGLLNAAQISDLTELVVSWSGRKADTAAVARATPLFAEQCSACHGVGAQGPGRGRSLQADIAAANHGQPLARAQTGLERLGVGRRPQGQDPGQIGAGQGQRPGPGPGRQDQNVIGQAPAIRQPHGPRRPVKTGNRRVQMQMAAIVPVPLGRLEGEAVGIRLALQPGLAERRALIGDQRFVADQVDGAGMTILPQEGRHGAARMAGPDNHHPRRKIGQGPLPQIDSKMTTASLFFKACLIPKMTGWQKP